MQHLCRAHVGQTLSAETVAQLRAIDHGACRFIASIRVRTTPTCGRCGLATSTRPLILGDVVPDTRTGPPGPSAGLASVEASPGVAVSEAEGAIPPQSQQHDHEDQNPGSVRRVSLSQLSMEMLPFLQRASALPVSRAVASRFAFAWAESLEAGLGGDATWALLCRYKSWLLLSNVSAGSDRNEEQKKALTIVGTR